MMILATVGQKIVRVGITPRANHIMHGAAKRIESVPIQTVISNRRHRAQGRKIAPHPVPGGQMRAV